MAEVSGDGNFPLPQVAKSLSPFIKTRQEALRIRRILSHYLASNLEGIFAGELSPTSLAVPGEDVQVKKIPSEVLGLRRSYLKALQAHAKAKKEYIRLTCDSSANTNGVQSKEFQDNEDSKESVATYLTLIREQQRYEKLKILQDYLDILSQKDAARPGYLQINNILEGFAPLSETSQIPVFPPTPPPTFETDTQTLTTRLEKAILCAKNALDNEKRLLAKIKEEQQEQRASGRPTTTISTDMEIKALSCTRDELISWIEEHLAKSSQSNDPVDKLSTPDSKSAPFNIEKRRKEIQDRYEDYLEARQCLVDLVLSSDTPPLKAYSEAEKAKPHSQEPIVESNRHEASSVLPYLTQHLIPAANAQSSFLRQDSYVSSTLASQNQATVQLLDRLAEESHLLPNYPVLARQPRFQKVVEALRSKSSPSTLAEARRSEDEPQILSQAQQWAFAADASRSTKQEAVKYQLNHGTAHIRTAEKLVKELQEILGVDGGRNEDDGDEDIWTESIQVKSQQQTSPSGRTGIWAGLDGKIGVETEKPRKES